MAIVTLLEFVRRPTLTSPSILLPSATSASAPLMSSLLTVTTMNPHLLEVRNGLRYCYFSRVADEPHTSLTHPTSLQAQYAVRGEIATLAIHHQSALERGEKRSFKKVTVRKAMRCVAVTFFTTLNLTNAFPSHLYAISFAILEILKNYNSDL
jgi:hypothetical protein